jgi:hypothetical protein
LPAIKLRTWITISNGDVNTSWDCIKRNK